MRLFVWIAESGSVSAAAQLLGVSQLLRLMETRTSSFDRTAKDGIDVIGRTLVQLRHVEGKPSDARHRRIPESYSRLEVLPPIEFAIRARFVFASVVARP
jgi:hypothetical protein